MFRIGGSMGEQLLHAFLQDEPQWIDGHLTYRQLTEDDDP
jgi:hypothetical protein